MKHMQIGGSLKNLEKNWSHLKSNQKDWILQCCRQEYIMFLNKEQRHPNKLEREEIVQNVYSLIEKKEIWIPYNEVKKAFCSKLNKYKKVSFDTK